MIQELFFESSHDKGFCGFKSVALKLDRLNVFFSDTTVNMSVCARFLWAMRSAAQNKFLRYISDPSEKTAEFLSAIDSAFLMNWEFFGAPSRGGVVAEEFSLTFDLKEMRWNSAEGVEKFAEMEIETHTEALNYLTTLDGVEKFAEMEIETQMIDTTERHILNLFQGKSRADQSEASPKLLVLPFPEAGIPPWRIEQLADAILKRLDDPSQQIFVQSAQPTLISLLCEGGGKAFLGYKANKQSQMFDLSLLDLSPAIERGTRIGDLWASMPPEQIIKGFDLMDQSEQF